MTEATTRAKPTRPRRAVSASLQDGRNERSVQTRRRVVSAILDLIRAGNLVPTSEEVADHAGVGHRTVFRHFPDMETLFEEVNARVRDIVRDGWPSAPLDGPLEDRIVALVEHRAKTFELMTCYYLSGDARLHTSTAVSRARAQFATHQREELLKWLPEAGGMVETVDLLTSMDGWLRLRRTQRLSVEQAKGVLIETLRRLINPGYKVDCGVATGSCTTPGRIILT